MEESQELAAFRGAHAAVTAQRPQEPNPQQWALDALQIGFEADKAELLLQLESMTKKRDELEAELQHSEGTFSALVESIIDEKLGRTLEVLRVQGAPPRAARGQQAVQQLDEVLDSMSQHHALQEQRVKDIQAALQQLNQVSTVQQCANVDHITQRHNCGGQYHRPARRGFRSFLGRLGGFAGSKCGVAVHCAMRVFVAGAQTTGRALKQPFHSPQAAAHTLQITAKVALLPMRDPLWVATSYAHGFKILFQDNRKPETLGEHFWYCTALLTVSAVGITGTYKASMYILTHDRDTGSMKQRMELMELDRRLEDVKNMYNMRLEEMDAKLLTEQRRGLANVRNLQQQLDETKARQVDLEIKQGSRTMKQGMIKERRMMERLRNEMRWLLQGDEGSRGRTFWGS